MVSFSLNLRLAKGAGRQEPAFKKYGDPIVLDVSVIGESREPHRITNTTFEGASAVRLGQMVRIFPNSGLFIFRGDGDIPLSFFNSC